jgi:hypothetical protein
MTMKLFATWPGRRRVLYVRLCRWRLLGASTACPWFRPGWVAESISNKVTEHE